MRITKDHGEWLYLIIVVIAFTVVWIAVGYKIGEDQTEKKYAGKCPEKRTMPITIGD